MKSPFQFGGIVSGNNFINRNKEIVRLLTNFDSNINTLLMSPRRWGKSSLIHKAAQIALRNNSNYRFCFIDLFNIRDENEFYSTLIKELIKSTSTKPEEWLNSARYFLKRVTPKITIGIDPSTDFDIKLDIDKTQKSYSEILNVSEKIAIQKKIKILICIDEFQNLSYFNDPLLFQKRLRANWQYHKNTVYCLFGSKRHMLIELFENKSMPFYKFGDTFYLEKLDTEPLFKYITRQFKKTEKDINPEFTLEIITLMKNHPYYVQQLAHLVWINTNKKVTKQILKTGIQNLLNQNSILYEKEIESLSTTQINFLRAITDNISNNFSSTKIIHEYNLGTSGNVIKIKNALIKKEIIDVIKHKPIILDPAFELWLKKIYFRLNK